MKALCLSLVRYIFVSAFITSTYIYYILILFHFKDECGEAAGKKKKFPLIFQVILQTKILERANAVSTMLQATNTDMQKALTLLDNTIKSLSTK